MKKIWIICICICLAMLAGCSNDNKAEASQEPTPTIALTPAPLQTPISTPRITPAEKFISTTSEEQLNAIMNKVIRLLARNITFTSADSLNSSALFQFYMGVLREGMEQWYNKEDKTYYVPVKDVISVLDTYFEKYVFDPNKALSTPSYNKEKDAIVLRAYGMGFTDYYKIENVSAITDDYVEIEAAFFDSTNDNNKDFPIYRTQLTIKVTDTGYHYISFIENLVLIDLATDERLEKYDSFYKYVSDGIGETAIIWTDMKLKDFTFFYVIYEEKGTFSFASSFRAGDTLFAAPELSPEKPLVAKLTASEILPIYGLSFLDVNGVKRYYSINEGGRGPEEAHHFDLIEFKNGNSA